MNQISKATTLCVVLVLSVVDCAPSEDQQNAEYAKNIRGFAARDFAEHQKQVQAHQKQFQAHQNQRFDFGGQLGAKVDSLYKFQVGNNGEKSFTFSDASDTNRKHVRDRGYGFEKSYAYSRDTEVLDLDHDKASEDFLSLIEGRDINREVQEKASKDIANHEKNSGTDLKAEEQLNAGYSE